MVKKISIIEKIPPKKKDPIISAICSVWGLGIPVITKDLDHHNAGSYIKFCGMNYL